MCMTLYPAFTDCLWSRLRFSWTQSKHFMDWVISLTLDCCVKKKSFSISIFEYTCVMKCFTNIVMWWAGWALCCLMMLLPSCLPHMYSTHLIPSSWEPGYSIMFTWQFSTCYMLFCSKMGIRLYRSISCVSSLVAAIFVEDKDQHGTFKGGY